MSFGQDLIKYPYRVIRPVYERTHLHRRVIEEVPERRLQWAYSYCRNLTREFAKTFYVSTRFLPRDKQRSIFAVYALCRYLDNIVDDTSDPAMGHQVSKDQVLQEMEEWKTHIGYTYKGLDTDNPILLAFSDVLRRHYISIDWPLELIDGVCMDLTKNRYENFDELYSYSYKVASVVGMMVSEIFGYDNSKALKHAEELGIAMQLTNILRDVGEDLNRDRIYLPKDEMRRFGITEEQVKKGLVDDAFRDFMRFQIDRAHCYYQKACYGIPMLSRDSRLPVILAQMNYRRILTKIEKNDYDVFSKRAYLTMAEKLSVVPNAWLHVEETPQALVKMMEQKL